MRQRRTLKILLLFGLAVAGVIVVLYLRAPAHRITRESVPHLQQGLTPAEVETILGVPPGDYRTRDVEIVFIVPIPPGGKQVVWHGNDGAILVHFDGQDRLTHAVFVPREAGQETFVEKVAQWMPLP